MLVPVYDAFGEKILGHLERAGPVCNEDHCDSCGDCLYCYGEDPCPEGIHTWLYYIDRLSPEDRARVVMRTHEQKASDNA